MSAVPNQGTCYYNGVTFDEIFRTHCTGRPVYDDAGRTVKWIEWTISVDGYVSLGDVGNSTDGDIVDHRKRLLKPGGDLRYIDHGFGDLWVNGFGQSPTSDAVGSDGNSVEVRRMRDVNWGPKPELYEWYPAGHDLSSKVSWRVVTCVPECNKARYEGLVSYNYQADFDLDQNGYTTRTISGHLEIAQSKLTVDTKTVALSADSHRAKVTPPIPIGFVRTRRHFSVSPNRSRLDFSFVDEEKREPFPEHATNIDATYSISSTLGNKQAFRNWVCNLSGTITVGPEIDKTTTWTIFRKLLDSKMGSVYFGGRQGNGRGNIFGSAFENIQASVEAARGQQPKRVTIPQRYSFRNDLYGPSASFDVEWRLYDVGLKDVFTVSNFWSPYLDKSGKPTTWAAWQKSMELDRVTNPYGRTDLQDKAKNDELIHLCNPDESVAPPETKPPKPNTPKPAPPLPEPPKPDPLSGWTFYENRLKVVENQRIVEHTPIPNDIDAFGPAVAAGGVVKFASELGRDLNRITGSLFDGIKESALLQEIGTKRYRIVMIGRASRIAHKVIFPRLLSLGGVPVVQLSSIVNDGQISDIGGIPLYGGSWIITYVLTKGFNGRPTLANPIFGEFGST